MAYSPGRVFIVCYALLIACLHTRKCGSVSFARTKEMNSLSKSEKMREY